MSSNAPRRHDASDTASSTAISSSTTPAIPGHIAIIMDGNNRWAKSRLLPKLAGHRAAVKAVRATVQSCRELGIQQLTLFAFSSENWHRPAAEVRGLMALLLTALQQEMATLSEHGVKLHIIGDRSRLNRQIQQAVQMAENHTRHCHAMVLNIAFNYGGRWDITTACRQLAEQVANGTITPDAIDEACVQQHLATTNIPPVDLLIRTSGEMRLSNFLLWQCAYSEFYFCDTLWPDFNSTHLSDAIKAFQARERRFGKTSEQV